MDKGETILYHQYFGFGVCLWLVRLEKWEMFNEGPNFKKSIKLDRMNSIFLLI